MSKIMFQFLSSPQLCMAWLGQTGLKRWLTSVMDHLSFRPLPSLHKSSLGINRIYFVKNPRAILTTGSCRSAVWHWSFYHGRGNLEPMATLSKLVEVGEVPNDWKRANRAFIQVFVCLFVCFGGEGSRGF